MIKPVYTQKDFHKGKVGIKFEGNLSYLINILLPSDKTKVFYKGQCIQYLQNTLVINSPIPSTVQNIEFVPEHEIYLSGTDIPKDEKNIPLRFSGGRDNSDVVASSQYYLIYQKKNCIINAVNSDDFIEFCKQLKIAKVKKKHIVEHNLSSDSLEKAFLFILPPKKKIGFRKFALDLLENDEVKEKALKAKNFLDVHYEKVKQQMIDDHKRHVDFIDDCIEKGLKGELNGDGIYPLMKESSKTDELGFEYPPIERVGKFHLIKEQPTELQEVANIAKAFQSPENIKEEDLQFDGKRKTFFEPEMQFIIKRQPQFFVTDSVVEYSKLITKFTPEAIKTMIEDGFLELTQKYIPGKCR